MSRLTGGFGWSGDSIGKQDHGFLGERAVVRSCAILQLVEQTFGKVLEYKGRHGLSPRKSPEC